ncbi:MAG TPA: GreA/GreB family elongation factor [Caulobacteraceae bacterium]|jgi:transcription elongation GreA/GreB family factor|nr:GreA/GreB family elongation factor [Caulobacteraceae bacterium]
MSRAFIRENDDQPPEPLPELRVSLAPNWVTARGLALIDACIDRLTHELHTAPNEAAAARAKRDLRYWTARRATAHLVEPHHGDHKVGFGSRVTVRRDDRPPEVIEIVGEDEADPFEGRLSWTSPMATALMGASPGEDLLLETRDPPIEIEVLAVDNG